MNEGGDSGNLSRYVFCAPLENAPCLFVRCYAFYEQHLYG